MQQRYRRVREPREARPGVTRVLARGLGPCCSSRLRTWPVIGLVAFLTQCQVSGDAMRPCMKRYSPQWGSPNSSRYCIRQRELSNEHGGQVHNVMRRGAPEVLEMQHGEWPLIRVGHASIRNRDLKLAWIGPGIDRVVDESGLHEHVSPQFALRSVLHLFEGVLGSFGGPSRGARTQGGIDQSPQYSGKSEPTANRRLNCT